jgi:hypothetical protein
MESGVVLVLGILLKEKECVILVSKIAFPTIAKWLLIKRLYWLDLIWEENQPTSEQSEFVRILLILAATYPHFNLKLP